MTDKKGYGDVFVNTKRVIFYSVLLIPSLKLLLPLEYLNEKISSLRLVESRPLSSHLILVWTAAVLSNAGRHSRNFLRHVYKYR